MYCFLTKKSIRINAALSFFNFFFIIVIDIFKIYIFIIKNCKNQISFLYIQRPKFYLLWFKRFGFYFSLVQPLVHAINSNVWKRVVLQWLEKSITCTVVSRVPHRFAQTFNPLYSASSIDDSHQFSDSIYLMRRELLFPVHTSGWLSFLLTKSRSRG